MPAVSYFKTQGGIGWHQKQVNKFNCLTHLKLTRTHSDFSWVVTELHRHFQVQHCAEGTYTKETNHSKSYLRFEIIANYVLIIYLK